MDVSFQPTLLTPQQPNYTPTISLKHHNNATIPQQYPTIPHCTLEADPNIGTNKVKVSEFDFGTDRVRVWLLIGCWQPMIHHNTPLYRPPQYPTIPPQYHAKGKTLWRFGWMKVLFTATQPRVYHFARHSFKAMIL